MPEQASIHRIAKLLARATSPEAAEAAAALEGAFKRMKRDGVSFGDLLTLPKSDLYQDILVKLIDLVLADQPELSPSSRRAAYEQYILLIVAKFSGGWDGKRAGDGDQAKPEGEQEAAAREYERRHRTKEAARSRASDAHSGTNQSHRNSQDQATPRGGKEFQSQNSQTPKQEKSFVWRWRRQTLSFSPTAFLASLQPVWGRGSVLWGVFHDPVKGLRLFAASLLWGMGFASVLIAIAAVTHALTNTPPLWDVRLKNLFAFLTAIGWIWRVLRFHRDGYFR
jgi:hypothetical protein